MLIMVSLNALPPLSVLGAALIDSTLLSILIIPVLYFTLFRPLTGRDSERKRRAQAAVDSAKQRLEIALEGSQISVWESDLRSNEIWLDAGWAVFLGKPRAETRTTAAELLTIVHPDDRQSISNVAVQAMKGEIRGYAVEHRVKSGGGDWKWILSRGRVIERDATGRPLRMSGTNTDITGRKQAENSEQFRSRILESLAGGEPLSSIIEAIVLGVERLNPAMLCSILLLDNEGRHFGKAVAPSLPDFYNAAFEGIEIGPGVGSCGTAAFTGERVIVEDIKTHPYWASYKELAASAGLGACWSQPIRSSSGQVLGTFAIYYREANTPTHSDIAIIEQSARLASIAIERKRAEAALRESETRIRAILDTALDAVIGIDDRGRITDWNAQAQTLFGWTRDEALGLALEDTIIPRQHRGAHRRGWDRLLATGQERILNRRIEITAMRRNGDEFPAELAVTQIKTGDTRQFTAFIEDISERKKTQVKINELAFYDQLTGLPNRTLLLDRLKQTMAASSRSGSHSALLFIDLDNFKTLNDTLGHDMGDMLLKQIAQRLTLCVREGDTVARLGGDEFVVLLAGLSTDEADAAAGIESAAEKMLVSLSRIYQLGNIAYDSTASIGATLFAGSGISIDDLMKQADLAMYKAKAAGRNTVRFFNPAMEVAVKERVALEGDLRRALEAEQFLLHYQAQVAGEGRLTGAEALVRWQHPQRGMVSPVEFIPLAEETGVILPLGLWVLETACARLAIWATRPEMARLTLSVNVSAPQFRHPDFVNQVLAVLESTGANPQRLKLELTESLLVHDVEAIIEKMYALKAKGVGFSMDDFGTGYSSLSYLKRLPLDQLKIDQSFVRDILTDPNDAAIARAIVTLARSLGLSVIAEGVETETQRDFLADSGCHAYQGYLFGRPLPIDGFEEFANRI